MRRRSPRAVVAWIAAALVALVTAHLVATDLAALHRRARSLGPFRSVVVAARDLPLGATVRASDVRVTRLPSRLAPPGAMASPSRATGRVVAVPAVRGAPLLARQLAPRGRDGLDAVVPEGSRAVRVVVEDGFRPPVGAVVDVLASLDPSVIVTEPAGSAATVARAARVLTVESDVDAGPAATRVGVTLLVAQDEAPRIAFAAANGVLTLALAPPEAACCHGSDSAAAG